MSYNLTQRLNHINENNYDDDISAVTGANQFIAVTANNYDPDTGQRTLIVQIMELEGVPAGVKHTNSGLFIRQDGEKTVKANLLDTSGKEVDSNVTDYS